MTHALHLTTWHPYVDEVAGMFVVEQCAALRAAGVDTGLIFSRIEGLRGLDLRRLARGRPGFVELNDPVPTLGFKSWNIPGLNGLIPAVNERMLRNRYAAYADRFGRPDILHAHVALEAGPATRRIATDAGLNYVVTEHSSEVLNGIGSPVRRRSAQRIYADAKCVLAVSAALAERIAAICPSATIKVIGNLVRDKVFALRLEHRPVREQITVVSIGSLSPNKRMHNAMAALAGLPRPLRDRIEHRIVGDGPERTKLEAQARLGEVRTVFHGNLPHDEAMALLADADLFLHASAYETFGVVLAEAMALGVPVVATRCGGPEGIVTAETGALVAVDDLGALRDAVEAILSEPGMWKARGGAIAHYARDRFHETRVASAIMGAYR